MKTGHISRTLDADFDGTTNVVCVLSGSQTNSAVGAWVAMGTEIRSVSTRGALVYAAAVTAGDVFRLEIEATHRWGQLNTCAPEGVEPVDSSWVKVYVDGEYAGKRELRCADGVYVTLGWLTPYLTNGTHEIKVYWDNVFEPLGLQVRAIRLAQLGGPDSDADGLKDWVAHRLAATCGLDAIHALNPQPSAPALSSVVSPVCVEGAGRYLSMMRLTADGAPCAALAKAGPDRWYADVPLSATNPTAVALSFESGGRMLATNIAWVPLNLLSVTNGLTIRKGDAVLFTAQPAGATNGAVGIEVAGVTNYATDIVTPVVHRFSTAGTFTVNGTWQEGTNAATGVATVKVVGAAFPKDSLPLFWSRPRTWNCPGVATGLLVQSDSAVTLGRGGADVTVTMDDVDDDHRLIARLPGGPVLASARLEGFWVRTSTLNRYKVVEVYADGSALWENTLVCGPLLPDGCRVNLSIFVGGVTFDDLALTRNVRPADLDATGCYTYRMLRSGAAPGSDCHSTKVYDDDPAFLGYALAGVGQSPASCNLPNYGQTTITYTPNPVYVGVGGTATVNVAITAASGSPTLEFRSGNPNVFTLQGTPPVTITGNGQLVVNGVGPGEAGITVWLNGTQTACPGPKVSVWRQRVGVMPLVAVKPKYVPVVEGNPGPNYGGSAYVFLANLSGFTITVSQLVNNITWVAAPQSVAQALPLSSVPLPPPYYNGESSYNNYMPVRLLPHTNGVFQVGITLFGTNIMNSPFTFTAVAGVLTNSADSVASSNFLFVADGSAIVPYFPPPQPGSTATPVAVVGELRGTPQAPGSPPEYVLTNMVITPPALSFVSNRVINGSTPRMIVKPIGEGEGRVTGAFDLRSISTYWNVTTFPGVYDMQQLTTGPYLVDGTFTGSLQTPYLISPRLQIASPSGTVPPDGETGSSPTTPANQALFVFDTNGAGTCSMTCETTINLAPASRDKVLACLEWWPPKVGDVWAMGVAPASPAPGRTNFLYIYMPTNNDAFGNTNIVLRFSSRPEWACRQDVQFRFDRTNCSASAVVASTMPNTVAAGNPNWYVYWQQVANQFGFGSQATWMYYTNILVGSNGEWASWKPVQKVPSWIDQITLCDTNKCGIFECIRSLHHENGHHQSCQLPPSQGGFGTGLAWSPSSDIDADLINDLWETNGIGSTLGFWIDSSPAGQDRDTQWRSNWDHGWTNTTGYGSCTNPPPCPPGPYTNTNGFSSATGSGLCPRNESQVQVQEIPIRQRDWSFIKP